MNSRLLVAHVSRRKTFNYEIRAFTKTLRREAGNRFDDVGCAFLELADPSNPDSIGQCIQRGATKKLILQQAGQTNHAEENQHANPDH